MNSELINLKGAEILDVVELQSPSYVDSMHGYALVVRDASGDHSILTIAANGLGYSKLEQSSDNLAASLRQLDKFKDS